mgnify:CR=1 FL=1
MRSDRIMHSSKAECEGAQEVIDLKTEVVENE